MITIYIFLISDYGGGPNRAMAMVEEEVRDGSGLYRYYGRYRQTGI